MPVAPSRSAVAVVLIAVGGGGLVVAEPAGRRRIAARSVRWSRFVRSAACRRIPQQGYFAAGMTEEIRGQLSQVASLRLLSRNGLDWLQGRRRRARVRELGVRNFVDGSVRVDGNRVRVSAELVDASNQQTLWSDQYDRDLADVLAVQSDIAQQIARALRRSLSPHEQTRLEQRPTDNVEAYKLYLQSQQLSSGRSRAQSRGHRPAPQGARAGPEVRRGTGADGVPADVHGYLRRSVGHRQGHRRGRGGVRMRPVAVRRVFRARHRLRR